MRLYSGLYAPPSNKALPWISRALVRHLQWCQLQNVEYTFVASPMNQWAKLCSYPWAWSFGTMIKLEAMRDFLEVPSRGDVFIWMDLDSYPEDEATIDDIAQFGSNVLSAPLTEPSFCGYPGLNYAHLNTYCKMIWGGHYRRPAYLSLSTGMFALSREAIENFWSWLNKDFHIDSAAWWAAYHLKQADCSELVRELGYAVEPFHFGTEEALMEDWLNSEPLEFHEFGFSVHGLCDSGNRHKFTHYYGGHKERYP